MTQKRFSSNALAVEKIPQEETDGASPEKVRYSDDELLKFKDLILEKLGAANIEYELLKAASSNASGNGTEDTSPTFKILEEGASALSKEEAGQLAQRQYKFIRSLEAALVRIENKSYGICRDTGKLIPKERLLIVPHATLCVESKNKQNPEVPKRRG